jgi:hypothetical protein
MRIQLEFGCPMNLDLFKLLCSSTYYDRTITNLQNANLFLFMDVLRAVLSAVSGVREKAPGLNQSK